MKAITIRAAQPDELERIRATYDEWGYDAGVENADTVLVAEGNSELIGLVRRTFEYDTQMLRGMQVKPEFRSLGIGTRLLAGFVERFGKEECYCIPYTLLVHFYAREGFEAIPAADAPKFLADRITRYSASGLDVTLMRRRGKRNASATLA